MPDDFGPQMPTERSGAAAGGLVDAAGGGWGCGGSWAGGEGDPGDGNRLPQLLQYASPGVMGVPQLGQVAEPAGVGADGGGI